MNKINYILLASLFLLINRLYSQTAYSQSWTNDFIKKNNIKEIIIFKLDTTNSKTIFRKYLFNDRGDKIKEICFKNGNILDTAGIEVSKYDTLYGVSEVIDYDSDHHIGCVSEIKSINAKLTLTKDSCGGKITEGKIIKYRNTKKKNKLNIYSLDTLRSKSIDVYRRRVQIFKNFGKHGYKMKNKYFLDNNKNVLYERDKSFFPHYKNFSKSKIIVKISYDYKNALISEHSLFKCKSNSEKFSISCENFKFEYIK
jgi:hypothetical protein